MVSLSKLTEPVSGQRRVVVVMDVTEARGRRSLGSRRNDRYHFVHNVVQLLFYDFTNFLRLATSQESTSSHMFAVSDGSVVTEAFVVPQLCRP